MTKFYLKQFQHFDGECFITFDILDIKEDYITVVVSKQGKLTVEQYTLYEDENGLYFEYGVMCDKIKLEDFE